MTCSAALVQVHDVGDGRLSDAELHDNLRTLLLAGFLTTTHLLGNGLAILLADPPRPRPCGRPRSQSPPSSRKRCASRRPSR